MQRLPLIVKIRKGWSGKERSSRFVFSRTELLLVLVLLFGCAGESPAVDGDSDGSEQASERVETRTDGDAQSSGGFALEDDDRTVDQKIRDASLTAQVQLALVEARDLRAFEFDPVVVNERVLLRGHVETLAQRERAASVAAGVEGIRVVVNDVTSTEQPRIAETGQPDTSAADSMADGSEAIAAAEGADVEGADQDDSDDVLHADDPEAEPESAPEATYHTVSSGDNLWDIARAYGVSVEQIQRLNDLRSNAIKPGQRIQVK